MAWGRGGGCWWGCALNITWFIVRCHHRKIRQNGAPPPKVCTTNLKDSCSSELRETCILIFVCLSPCLYLFCPEMSVWLSVCLPACLYLSVCLSVCICVSACLYVCETVAIVYQFCADLPCQRCCSLLLSLQCYSIFLSIAPNDYDPKLGF